MARRTRKRNESLDVDRGEIADRIRRFWQDDRSRRSSEREVRLQRYAKFRMWTEGKDWPWENASDIGMSDMQEKSLRMQDTLHNAVMSNTPPVGAVARHKADREKTGTVDSLIWHQLFVDADGEKMLGDIADNFVNDGVFTVFIPWIEDRRESIITRVLPPIPEELPIEEYFLRAIGNHFPRAENVRSTARGWNWNISADGEPVRIEFYTRDNGDVEMVTRSEVEVFNGPRPIVKPWEEVFFPHRAENLQIPSPSNPRGSAHVILVDYPTIDEIKRLGKSGWYDMMTDEEIDSLDAFQRSGADEEEELQVDTFQGTQEFPTQDRARDHRQLTRLLVFDMFDVDDDGVQEDVIWWYLEEPKLVVRARFMTEMYPSLPPRRPFAEASFIPVPGRRQGISLLEQLEPLHDAMKTYFDQSVDAGTISNSPFGFYRPTSSMKPEVMRLWPGELYPVSDPQRDVIFPTIGNPQASVWGINMTEIVQQMQERLTVVGDLQLGRVPDGKATALRTAGGIAMLSGQAESRPERILRRFFMGLTQIWMTVHNLNQYFLPEKKEIQLIGSRQPFEDPYHEITARDEVSGQFQFEFKANVFNASKAALQQAMQALLTTYVSPLAIQMGILDEDGIYRLFRDFGRAWGQDPDRYLREVPPGLLKPKILAEEAISTIMYTVVPDGPPAEAGGAIEHLQKLQLFMQSEQFGLLSPTQVEIFRGYLQQVVNLAQAQARQQQAAAAAGQAGQALGGTLGQGPGRPMEQAPNMANAPLQPGELRNETLTGA